MSCSILCKLCHSLTKCENLGAVFTVGSVSSDRLVFFLPGTESVCQLPGWWFCVSDDLQEICCGYCFQFNKWHVAVTCGGMRPSWSSACSHIFIKFRHKNEKNKSNLNQSLTLTVIFQGVKNLPDGPHRRFLTDQSDIWAWVTVYFLKYQKVCH